MALRVTQGMMNTQLLRNISNHMKRMSELQNQLSSGRRINAPSDDPVGITFALRYRTELAANEQYQENADAALSQLDYVDTLLDQVNQVLQRLRELAVKGANGTNPQDALDAISAEVEELYQQLVDIGNSKLNGKYVFNGQLTDVKPYPEQNASAVSTDDRAIQYEVGAGLHIPVNVTGNEVFGTPGEADNIFKIMEQMITDLAAGDHGKIGDALELIDQRISKVLDARATIGARTNRIELVSGRLEDIGINLQTLQSKIEDADMAEVITNLKMAENVYQAALSTGAMLIRPSLVDFFR
mgnify:CR=1 FL=1